MLRLLTAFLTISLLLNIILICSGDKDIDIKPPWEPFELNSNLTLKSIVEDGYRFGAMPCGQVQFVKTIADTSIQYEVHVDCKNYSKWWNTLFTDETEALWKRKNVNDPYYPFTQNEVSACYERINWRIYRVRMSKPNISKIRTLIEKKNCQILTDTEKWDDDIGGNFIVYNPESYLYFQCTISKRNSYNNEILEDLDWEFKTISSIPYLDSEKIIFERERNLKIEQFEKGNLSNF